MPEKYFEIEDDVHIPGRWYVGSPLDAQGTWILPRVFFQGRHVDLDGEPITPLNRPGRELDFSMTEVATYLVSHRFVSLCERLGLQDQVQFIRTRVEGYTEPYFILIALRLIRCVDEARCVEVRRYEPQEGEPELVGQYRHVVGLKIDPSAVGDAEIFHPWGWTVALIVSERLKRAIEDEGLVRPAFQEV